MKMCGMGLTTVRYVGISVAPSTGALITSVERRNGCGVGLLIVSFS